MKIASVAGREIPYNDALSIDIQIHLGLGQRIKILFGKMPKVYVDLFFLNDKVDIVAYEAGLKVSTIDHTTNPKNKPIHFSDKK